MSRLTIVLVGIGGYGSGYVNQLLDSERDDFTIQGIVDPYPENYPDLARLTQLNIPIYDSIEEFYAEHQADLAVISSPIHFHCQQTTVALANGSHVLCEKPISATIQEALVMLKAQKNAQKKVGIGYQWSFSDPILNLKNDIMTGKLGKPLLLKTLVLWPRNNTYYSRGWAGKLQAENGNWVLDSVANNATAHYLHNMFYVLGDQVNTSASLAKVEAELYRANPIENYDTCMLKASTTEGVELLFYASHAVNNSIGPIFEYRFSDAVIRYNEGVKDPEIVVKYNDGTWKSYGNPKLEPRRKLWMMIDAIIENKEITCGIEAALTQTICINGTQQSSVVRDFPCESVKYDQDSDTVYVENLDTLMADLYQIERLPYQSDVKWAERGKEIDLINYRNFTVVPD